MKTKRMIAIILSTMMAMSLLAGCGANQPSVEDSSAGTTVTEEKTVDEPVNIKATIKELSQTTIVLTLEDGTEKSFDLTGIEIPAGLEIGDIAAVEYNEADGEIILSKIVLDQKGEAAIGTVETVTATVKEVTADKLVVALADGTEMVFAFSDGSEGTLIFDETDVFTEFVVGGEYVFNYESGKTGSDFIIADYELIEKPAVPPTEQPEDKPTEKPEEKPEEKPVEKPKPPVDKDDSDKDDEDENNNKDDDDNDVVVKPKPDPKPDPEPEPEPEPTPDPGEEEIDYSNWTQQQKAEYLFKDAEWVQHNNDFENPCTAVMLQDGMVIFIQDSNNDPSAVIFGANYEKWHTAFGYDGSEESLIRLLNDCRGIDPDSGSTEPPVDPDPDPQPSIGDVYEAVKLINEERVKSGLPEIEADETLMQLAQVRAEEQVSLFGHTRPDGSDWYTIFDGHDEFAAMGKCENCAAGSGTAAGTITQWMNSTGHRENILKSDLKKVGIGFVQDENSEYTYYWVMLGVSYTE